MANNLEKAQIFQNTLDKQMVQQSVTGFMEINSSMVQYTGGDTVRIPDIKTQGLKNYDRANGFGSAGGVDLKWQTHTFDKDRSQTFNIDDMDLDETAFMASATNVMATFQSTQVIPEVDSYRFSKIYEYALADGNVGEYTPAVGDIFQQLTSDIANVQDIIGETEEMVICMNYQTANTLDLADKIEKKIVMSEFTQGGISTKVRTLDNIPIIRVPSLRFKNEYDFLNVDPYGFAPKTGALDLNWIIMARKSVIAITKTDKMRVFDPATNQNADAYKIDYRKFHTLWIPDNKLVGVYVSRKPAVAVVSDPFTLLTANNTTTVTLTDGKFKADVGMADFSFAGTDAAALAAGTGVRTSDTVFTITHATGNTGTDNVVTVEGSGLELQASAVTGAGSTV